MKKLNRKGFTLVELLAVIIILAIVVGISIPAVLTTTSKAKSKALQTAADSAADWIDRQYQVAVTGISVGTNAAASLDSNFSGVCGSLGATCEKTITNGSAITGVNAGDALIVAAGLKTSNVSTMKIAINKSTGRACVTLTAKAGGDYSNGTDTPSATGGACGASKVN